MYLISRINRLFKGTAQRNLEEGELVLDSDIKNILEDIAKPIPSKPKGRVIKQARHSEFNPNPIIQGGRIVKVMPRQLQKIKQAQEKFEDDGPSLEDFSD